MKKLILLGLVTLLWSCNQKQRYTQQSKEIDTYKQVIAAYEKQDWEKLATFYADTAKVLNNVTKKNAQTVAQLVAQSKEEAQLFSGWKYVPSESEYEMVVTDKGETWVNFFGLWHGTLKANKTLYEIPSFITARFIDGKIVQELGFWDVSKLTMDIQKLKETSSANTDAIPPK